MAARTSTIGAALLLCLLILWRKRRRRSRGLGEHGQRIIRSPRPGQKTPREGQLLRLSRGLGWVQTDGTQNDGPWVVLVHGNIGSSFYLSELAHSIARKGRRVLRLDLYGRGWSSCDGFPHSWHLFVGQIAEVLFSLGIEGPVDLVGFSLGGCIAAYFAATFPERIRSLVLLCPAMYLPISPPLARIALVLLTQFEPIRWLIGMKIVRGIRRKEAYQSEWTHLASSSKCRKRLEDLWEAEEERFMEEPALVRSAGLTVACMPWGDDQEPLLRLGEEHASEARHRFGIDVVWAMKDKVIDSEDGDRKLQKVLPHARVTHLPEHGHSLPYEHPELTASLLQMIWHSPQGDTLVPPLTTPLSSPRSTV
eukprot:gnl/TRDRNA2_/TRDRNA2_204682_c0_seq1.p1 gnl/TRDRNA2_/TRDRNA2_204682_c0~~gnl/TRDRNA2_/TRDRNA2_204682_c0_seq1.p1  ORF type:complete len:365 (+),score=45.55 gnl/TRDRNA2_/TRDRNA2_204682_c0_seq1:18-1112(+)